MKNILGVILSLLFAVSCFAQEPTRATKHRWPAQLAVNIGSEFKQTFYTDFRQHPVAHGLSMGVRLGIAFADTAVSCRGYQQGLLENPGLSRYIIGTRPSCHKAILSTSLVMAVHEPAVNWLSHAFKDSCDRDAANPDSKWGNVQSHTKSTAACYWGPQWADTIVIGAIEIPAIKSNIDLLK
jgi:hypothetical protein